MRMEHSGKWQTAKRISSFFVQQQTTKRNARLLQISEKKVIAQLEPQWSYLAECQTSHPWLKLNVPKNVKKKRENRIKYQVERGALHRNDIITHKNEKKDNIKAHCFEPIFLLKTLREKRIRLPRKQLGLSPKTREQRSAPSLRDVSRILRRTIDNFDHTRATRIRNKMAKTRPGKYKQPEYTSYNTRNDDTMTTDCQKTYLTHKKVTK